MASMIRFEPDTWKEALLRPIAMLAPDAGVYVEIMAPDFRFCAVVILLILLGIFARPVKWEQSPTVVLLLFVVLAFAVWLSTSGNGRYFFPGLLIVGPLCIGLTYRLPFTRNLKFLIASCVLALQGFVVYQATPWQTWGLAPWGDEPFYGVELDQEASTVPATYITVTSISYSLIAPQFPAASRWMNISSQADPDSVDGRRVQDLLATSKSIQLLIPTVPDHVTASGQPDAEISEVINDMLENQRLALNSGARCRLLRSRGLASQHFNDPAVVRRELLDKVGFWVCPLDYPVRSVRDRSVDLPVEIGRAFTLVESKCPRFFAAGQTAAARVEGGWLRVYPHADLKLYVMDSGQVFYKYWRAMNPVLIGNLAEIGTPGFDINCAKAIRGRSGLPWEREI
jgi:hypothetical protein